MGDVAERPATYREVFSVGQFRALFAADLTSLLGDQVAAVALAVLLYQRSGSALVAALGYATAYLPWAVGGPLLSTLADRLPGRRVAVSCDLARAALIGTAALPGMPLPVLGLLVLVAALLAPPFDAAVSAQYVQALDGDRYPVAMSVRNVVHQASQLTGFVGGGALVVLIGARGALILDAVTFAVSAALLRLGLPQRPAALDGAQRQHLLRESLDGLRLVGGDRRMAWPLLLGVVGAAYVIVPEAIAPAYARSLGRGPGTVGLVMASVAAGSIVGSVVVGRLFTPGRRRRLMWPMAVAGTVPLAVVAGHPGLVASLVLFTLAGIASAYQVSANASFAAAIPPQARGRAFGVAMTAMYGGQGLAIVAAGAAAQVLPPATVVAGAAAVGAVILLLIRPLAAPDHATGPPTVHAVRTGGTVD